MSLAGILSSSISQTNTNNAQNFWHERRADVRQLALALKSGDLDSAKQAFDSLSSLAQEAPFRSVTNFTPFQIPRRALDFLAIGNALDKGDLDGARQAFAVLQNDLAHAHAAQNQASNLLDIVLHLSGLGTQGDNANTATTPTTNGNPAQQSDSTQASSTQQDSGQTSSTPPAASSTTASTTDGGATSTSTQNSDTSTAGSTPEIVLNLGGNSSPQIVLNLGSGSVSEVDLRFGGTSGGGTAAREIVLKFGDQAQSHTLEIDILA
ncbi:MAG: hypothetical protein DMG89_14055 [Acidobacteria bacterium]|nr:MAG: hypothetical protein DMG89_14055 [Acidobacteriota bacterium]